MPSSALSTFVLSTPSLHDALPIYAQRWLRLRGRPRRRRSLRRPPGDRCRGATRAGLRCRDGSQHHQPSPGSRDAAASARSAAVTARSEEHTSELQSPCNLVCRLLLYRPSSSPLLPYTTLFRSMHSDGFGCADGRGGVGPCAVHQVIDAAVRRGLDFVAVTDHNTTSHHQDLATLQLQHDRLLLLRDRKSTRLNSSHLVISYAVFCSIDLRPLHSFPTRRSSDLCTAMASAARTAAAASVPAPSTR